MGEYPGKDRREFVRYNYYEPMKYQAINFPKDKAFSALEDAMSQNLSACGILFVAEAKKTPAISSLVVLDLDYRTANICKEIEEKALMIGNKLIGRVARIEDNSDGTFGVGVAFVRKTDPIAKEINKIEDLIKRA